MSRQPVHYVECPVCEANFKLPKGVTVLPPHRGFRGEPRCPGGAPLEVGLGDYTHEAGSCYVKPYGHHTAPVFCGDPRCATNPRYVTYARVHGRTPAQQRAHDAEAWPGGRMAGFTLWIQERWREWRQLRGYERDSILSDADHVDFDAWLAQLPATGT